MTNGISGFLITGAVILVVTLLCSYIGNRLTAKFEFRKGFNGTKSSPLFFFRRLLLFLARIEGERTQILFSSLKLSLVLLCAAVVPNGFDETSLSVPHSLQVFMTAMIAIPILSLITQWVFNSGAAWPISLKQAERALGVATSIAILMLALIAICGSDSIYEIYKTQEGTWLIFNKPLSIFVLGALLLTVQFVCFQNVFRLTTTPDIRPEGSHLSHIFQPVQRAVWGMFLATVFLGGAQPHATVLGLLVLIIKIIALDTLGKILLKASFQFNERQSEDVVLWKLAPLGIVIYFLATVF